MPDLTVVIPIHGQLHSTRRLLDSLEAQTCQDFSVVIEDDRSDDGSVNVLRASGYEVRTSPERRYFNGILRPWIAECQTPFLAFLNNDLWLAPNYVEEMLDRFEDGWDILVPLTNEQIQRKGVEVVESRVQEGWALGLRIQSVRGLPPIPTDLRLWYGDTWLFHHAWRAGLRIGRMMRTKVDHEESRTLIANRESCVPVIDEDHVAAQKYGISAVRP